MMAAIDWQRQRQPENALRYVFQAAYLVNKNMTGRIIRR